MAIEESKLHFVMLPNVSFEKVNCTL